MKCNRDCFTCPIGIWIACKRGKYVEGKAEWLKEVKSINIEEIKEKIKYYFDVSSDKELLLKDIVNYLSNLGRI